MTSTAKDPGELLGVDRMTDEYPWSAGTLYAWRHKAQGPPSVRLGRRIFWRRSDVESWIADQARAEQRGRADHAH